MHMEGIQNSAKGTCDKKPLDRKRLEEVKSRKRHENDMNFMFALYYIIKIATETASFVWERLAEP